MASTPRLLFDARHELGEGPLWHPLRRELFWFAITDRQLHACDGEGRNHRQWEFDEMVSAAGWVDEASLLIASAGGLWRFDIGSGRRSLLAGLEADDPATRSNDGRADPAGGFWIGTMGRQAETGAGAIYRFAGGRLARKRAGISISNSICFSPDGSRAYFCDTPSQRIMQWRLERESGETIGEPEIFTDLSSEGLHPDGSVVDADGCLWNAQWGASRVARYDPDGAFMEAVTFPVSQVTCPAFGGPGLGTLYVTSARQGMDEDRRRAEPLAGSVFAVEVDAKGRPEPAVRLEAGTPS